MIISYLFWWAKSHDLSNFFTKKALKLFSRRRTKMICVNPFAIIDLRISNPCKESNKKNLFISTFISMIFILLRPESKYILTNRCVILKENS